MVNHCPDNALDTADSIVLDVIAEPSAAPDVTSFFNEATSTVTHLVKDPNSNSCAIIDSVLDFEQASGRAGEQSANALIDFIHQNGLKVEWLLETHAHADHLSAAPVLQKQLGGRLAIGAHITDVRKTFGRIFNDPVDEDDENTKFDHLFHDGETFQIGALKGCALHVPGHTPACMAYVIGDAVFPGDTLFMPDYGTARCDFPGGDSASLYRSIRRLLSLPKQAKIFLCHDYKAPGREEYIWETSVGAQRTDNIHVHDGVTEAEFVAMRDARDATLGMPKLMLPSIQVNMHAGYLPEPESNGVRYLKIPLNQF
jgi:glyoxylase-like metal-dependent hydrolase (beta-lactamase superfamily II)